MEKPQSKTMKEKVGARVGSPPRITLVAGIGNPGGAYKNTYHNAGIGAIDLLADRSRAAPWKKAGGLFEYARAERVVFVRSLVFMNESGRALAAAKKKFGARIEEILLVHDDSDIALGNWKISFGRNAAGHKGVESVILALGGKGFWRLRIGIRNPENKKRAMDFVLQKIRPGDRAKLEAMLERLPKFANISF